MKKKQPIFYIITALILYMVSTGASYAVFRAASSAAPVAPAPKDGQTGHFVIDPSLPKTEECPINGKMFTKQERDIWEKRRPLAVAIENHTEARPQSGLSYADVVYEAVAEGGITRFTGIFHCGAAAYNVKFAPVRSAREVAVKIVQEYDALFNHVGGAGNCNDPTVDERAKALCQIQQFGVKDMDQFSLPFKVCRRNQDRLGHEVATEHTMECFANALHTYAQEKYDWTNTDEEGTEWTEAFEPWKFKDSASDAERGSTGPISLVHWEGYEKDFGIQWQYDKAGNLYKRFMAGQPHTDLETKEQLTATNVIVQFAKETVGVDEHAHVLYETVGTGKALVFQDGKVIEGTWKKAKRASHTKFFDSKGKEISLVRGPVWVEIVDTAVKVNY